MNIAFHCADAYFNNNRMFENENVSIGDSLLYPLILFKEMANSMGHRCDTLDRYSHPDEVDVLFLSDARSGDSAIRYPMRARKFLLTFESPIWNGYTHNIGELHHEWFEKVFTYRTDILKKIPNGVQVFLPNKWRITEKFNAIRKTRFMCAIFGNKQNDSSLFPTLYTKRMQDIFWLGNNYNKFHLYGQGWEKENFPFYQGPVERKIDVLSKYRFALAYENCICPGYISEKIIDCLLSLTIPLYKGAPDVLDYIPKECFIDLNKFSVDDVVSDLAFMSNDEYNRKIDAIFEWVAGRGKIFSAENWVNTIARECELWGGN
jgi:hypothetical protein